ncbi:polyprenyl synthetase family protein [uncultured Limosilactobacillus sp.]|uniref:polyprenyl synthetase family protein n=1 Tax=uncultured Limosilactobacillus sp. TaxID=2837629 RepID=UPI0025F78405|nr:farnesyl diphosphate synthase [uncultured Limosilactobacillus sp.]
MIQNYQNQINHYLNDHTAEECAEPTLSTATMYSLMAGGKRLRPALTLAICDAFKVPINQDVLRAACAVELLHTYSLIHDDLPAMDNDDLRRGRPTNHRRFGAGMATLAGDGLLTLAFQWVSDNHLPNKIQLELVRELSRAAGPTGMVAGQAMDIHNEGQRLGLSELRLLHRKKTGALLRYAVLAGGIITGQTTQVKSLLARFGENYGLAFQIYDDLMDVIGSEGQMGKAVHKDQVEQKNTYPNLLGLEETKRQLSLVLDQTRKSKVSLEQQTHCDFKVLEEFLAYFNIGEME